LNNHPAALCPVRGVPHSLVGRYAHDDYGGSAPASFDTAQASLPLDEEKQCRFSGSCTSISDRVGSASERVLSDGELVTCPLSDVRLSAVLRRIAPPDFNQHGSCWSTVHPDV